MKQITMLQDGMNYHLLIADKSVWLNMKELDALQKTIETAKQSQFKEGDFLRFEGDYDLVIIFAAYTGDGNWHEHASISLGSMELQTGLHITANDCEGYKVRLANENEKKLLLLALKESGYKWNEETKKVEVNVDGSKEKEIGKYYYFECENEMAYIAKLIEDCGDGTLRFGEHIAWNPIKQDIANAEYDGITLVLKKRDYNGLVPATRAEILTLEKLRREFTQTVNENSCRFELYEKVLVRDREDECWFPAIFVKFDKKKEFKYHCLLLDTGSSTDFRFCEPYNGNESFVYDDTEILPF